MLMLGSCESCVRLEAGKLYRRACSEPGRLLTVMTQMIRLSKPMTLRQVTVVLLVVALTSRAAAVADLEMAGTKLLVVVATIAKSPTTALGTGPTALKRGTPLPGALVRTPPTGEKASAPGKATTNEARVGMTTPSCSSVTNVLATRPSARGVPSMVILPKRVAYLMVSKASTAVAISKRSVPERLDPSDRLPA